MLKVRVGLESHTHTQHTNTHDALVKHHGFGPNDSVVVFFMPSQQVFSKGYEVHCYWRDT